MVVAIDDHKCEICSHTSAINKVILAFNFLVKDVAILKFISTLSSLCLFCIPKNEKVMNSK